MPHEEMEAAKVTPATFGDAYQGDGGYTSSVRILSSRRMIGDQAPDIVQTAWLLCWRSRSKLRDKDCLGSYVRATVRNLVVDVARRGMRFDQLPPEYDPEGPDRISLDAILVRQVLGKLAPRQKRLLELVYFEGFTRAEVARSFSTTTGAVYSALARARKAFRAHFEGDFTIGGRSSATVSGSIKRTVRALP